MTPPPPSAACQPWPWLPPGFTGRPATPPPRPAGAPPARAALRPTPPGAAPPLSLIPNSTARGSSTYTASILRTLSSGREQTPPPHHLPPPPPPGKSHARHRQHKLLQPHRQQHSHAGQTHYHPPPWPPDRAARVRKLQGLRRHGGAARGGHCQWGRDEGCTPVILCRPPSVGGCGVSRVVGVAPCHHLVGFVLCRPLGGRRAVSPPRLGLSRVAPSVGKFACRPLGEGAEQAPLRRGYLGAAPAVGVVR